MLLYLVHGCRIDSVGRSDLFIATNEAFGFDELETADPPYGGDTADDPKWKDEVADLAAVAEDCATNLESMCP